MPRLLLALAIVLALPTTGRAQSLEGVWQLVEVEVRGGPNPVTYTDSQIQPSYLFYVGDHFAYLIDRSSSPRQPVSNPSDSAIVESIRPLGFAAGTFEREGMTIRYHRTTALNPFSSQPENQPQIREIEVLTADRLETTAGTNEETGAKTILKYVRVE